MKILGLFLIIFSSCKMIDPESKSKISYYNASFEQFKTIINNSKYNPNNDFSTERSIINLDYPIEIYLFQDNRWHYDLPNLGKGNGTWEYNNGRIKLFAKRSLFDMHIDILASDRNAEAFAIRFSDRFGPQYLNMETRNTKGLK